MRSSSMVTCRGAENGDHDQEAHAHLHVVLAGGFTYFAATMHVGQSEMNAPRPSS